MNTRVANYFFFTLIILCCYLLLSGCALEKNTSHQPLIVENDENFDSTCAYFYFLWGNHAEYNQRLEEALEAFEKAALCDPNTQYISEKIPLLLIRLGKRTEAISWLESYLKNHPTKQVQRFLLARLQIQAGANQKALSLYQDALALDPENRNVQLRIALLFGHLKQYNEAKSILKNLLSKDPQLYYAALYLARIYTHTKDTKKADVTYNQALAINWSEDLIFEMAGFHSQHQHHEKVIQLYQLLLKQDQYNERAVLGTIQALLYLEKNNEALQKLEGYRKISNRPENIDIVIAQIHINNKSYKKAELLLLTLLNNSPSSEAYYLISIAYYEQKKYNSALETLPHISSDSEEFESSIYLQVKIFIDSDRSQEAQQFLEKTIRNKDSRKPIFYSYLSTLYKDDGKSNQALQTLRAGIEEYPQDEDLHFEYGLILESTGKSSEALAVMEKVLTLQPNHPEALNFIGYTWADKNQNLDQALKYIQQAVIIKPESGFIRDSLGWVYFRLGDLEKAKIELEHALVLEPTDPHIYDHLGDTYRAMTNREKAIEKYRKALEMFTENDKKQAVQEKINALSES